jgi:hypothetical protein
MCETDSLSVFVGRVVRKKKERTTWRHRAASSLVVGRGAVGIFFFSFFFDMNAQTWNVISCFDLRFGVASTLIYHLSSVFLKQTAK